MNTLIKQAAIAAVLLLGAGSASAGATVTFSQPEQFTDVPSTFWERERILKHLTKHFDVLAAQLPAGQELQVEVLDLDMAGRFWPGRTIAHELRILNGGADWPHMKLRYTITQGGTVVKSGEENLSNMSYMHRMNRYVSGDSLRYEKQMLDDWFKESIIAAR
jgi:hypothetical protein